ncbi:integrin beta-8 [Periophthalmus magnuspinnatus]|uniref:integrin beta-8 n=1 Tax=Periophthalmus magnuspinnatus TaxID=409849 RepID=UPI00145C1655|nr:integrin beta-8 [Periophthalmus magnuspinnatus]
MNPWLRSFHPLLLCFLLVVALCTRVPRPGENVCRSSNLTSCTECLKRGPQCAWCFKENFLEGAASNYRCDLAENLLLKGCESEFLEQTETKVEVDTTISSTQVSPQDISVHLGPGSQASVVVAVKQLERYPVDLYSLVDVSASMQENLDHLKTVGVALSLRMTQHSSDLWLGFGSFVDKPVSPYISVHPSKINNPCSDYEVRCRPAHGFHHVLSMTGNMSEFTRVIKRQRISGNMDTPEGGLDAMLQAVVCQKAVGWRPEAKRLLLFMTDQPSHLALDSRLAGIVIPNDGLCHLEDNIYTASTVMDHPSLGQLSDKLLENHIYSIFAVEKQQYQWYEKLVRLLPATYLRKLGLFQASSLIELVVEAYKELLSEVAVAVSFDDRASSRFWVSVAPLCPNGSTANQRSCSGVQPGQTVYFNITVGMRSCPDNGEDEDISVTVRPVGYNESSVIRIHSKCGCRCESAGLCHNSGQACEETGQEQRDSSLNQSCQSAGSDLMCSGRGVCECGRCVCDQNRLGTIYGKYCEKDDFSCPYFRGLMCGGHGDCVLGECVCKNEWTGESCECPASSTSCQSADGLLCSGHGECVCGRCVCSDSRRSGSFCERCPACQSTCQSNMNCVVCHVAYGLSKEERGFCNKTCTTSVNYSDNGQIGDKWVQCMYVSNNNCRYPFQITTEVGQAELHINTRAECPSSSRVGTFLSVCALTVLCGLVVVAVSRLLLQRRHQPPGGTVADGVYNCTEKDLSYIPTTNEKTVTYRRDRPPDRPVEMNIQVPKMPFNDPWH